MLIGYISLAADQLAAGVSEPHNALIAHGVNRLYIDVDLGQCLRPQLETAIGELGAGDVLVSPSINTLARSVPLLLDINERLEARGASLRILHLAGGLSLDTGVVEGRAILGALAVMSLMPPPVPSSVIQVPTAAEVPVSERLLEHLGPTRPRGRPATAGSQAAEVNRLRGQGLRAVEIAACLGIGRASVYRILSQGQMDGGIGEPRTTFDLDRLRVKSQS